MPPKRNVKTSNPEKKGKVSLKCAKKAQPLKIPTKITLEIPLKANGLDVSDTARKVDGLTKIALANEVARSQLLKEPIEPRLDSPPKKRGRKKKEVVSQFFNNDDGNGTPCDTDKVTKTPSVKKTIKKPAEKTPTVKKQQKTATKKRAADSTVKKPTLKRKRKTSTQEMNADSVTSKPDTTTGQAKEPDETVPKKIPSLFNPPTVNLRKRRNLSLKQNSNTREASPILQSKYAKKPKTDRESKTSPEQKSQSNDSKDIKLKAGQIDSRKTSLSSFSNLSWIRDISSSETTSIIISPNEIIRFDNKLPVIKLTNIDSDVKKYKAKTAIDNKSSSVYSESSNAATDLSKVRSPLKATSLNLSSSSVSNASDKEQSNTDIKKDYRKAAENIKHALKQIDKDFITWLQRKDCVRSDYNKMKDNLYDIMKNEFKIISHCRHSWKLLKPDSNIDVDNINSSETDGLSINSNKLEGHKLEDNKSKTDVRKVTGNNETNTKRENEKAIFVECNKVSPKKAATRTKDAEVEFNKSIPTFNQNKQFQITRSFAVNQTDTNNTNTKVPNRFLGNRFNSNTKENIKSNKFELIKVEFNRNGNKRIGFSSTEVTETMQDAGKMNQNRNETETVVNKLVGAKKTTSNTDETNKVTLETSESMSNRDETSDVTEKQTEKHEVITDTDKSIRNECNLKGNTLNMLEEEIARPSTSDMVSHTLKETRSRTYSSDSSSYNSDGEDYARYRQCATHDDDDALSLFAESITGMESSRNNTSVASASNRIEEYIPKPVNTSLNIPQNYTYCPTKIPDVKNVGKTVCEKQNADSTSIHKESGIHSPEHNTMTVNEQTEVPFKDNSHAKQTHLLEDVVQTKPGDFNTVFVGYCVLNLMHKCPLAMYDNLCRYSHEKPSKEEILSKMSKMDKQRFIKEYLILRRRSIMLLNFGMCFVYECVRRNDNRMMIEIAFDFITRLKSNQNEKLITEAVETILLRLNQVELSDYEDLLLLKVDEDLLLCDVFMKILTSTQNFSRFKPVFINLTYFLVANDRTINLEIAEHVLERVCILPFDEALTKALLQVIRLTYPKIFLNSMIDKFEKLISGHQHIAEEYWMLKEKVCMAKQRIQSPMKSLMQIPTMKAVDKTGFGQQYLVPPVVQPLRVQTMEPLLNNRAEGVRLPSSPDTTHLDSMNKTMEETVVPKITRTINGKNFIPQHKFTPDSPGLSPTEEVTSTPNHRNWRNRSIFQQIRPNYSPLPTIRPGFRSHNRYQRGRRPFIGNRLVTFERSPLTYPPPEPDI